MTNLAPVPVVTAWGTQATLPLLALAALLAALTACYLFALTRNNLSAGRIAIVVALIGALGMFWRPIFSSDVYAYAAYGRMILGGFNPYVRHPQLAGDVFVAAANAQWSGIVPICVYGPAAVAIDALAVALAHSALPAALALLRIFSIAALIACVYSIAAWRDARSAAVITLHPLVLWSAIEGHNDTIMLAAIFWGLALGVRRPLWGAAAMAFAACVKLPALVASTAHTFSRPNAQRTLIWACAALVTLASYTPLLLALRAQFAPHARYAPQASVQSLGLAVTALLAIAVAIRARAYHGNDRWCIAALVLWLAIANPYPWYACWLVPLTIVAVDGRVRATLFTTSAATILHDIPDAYGTIGTLANLALGGVALLTYTPLFWRRAIMTRPC